ncbi:MAG: MFS transporter [Steroidobacteraceae bacterium]
MTSFRHSVTREQWRVVTLVAMVTLATFINYFDRGNVPTAAPLMQGELGLSARQLGLLFSAFYWGYVPCMPATGWLAERFGARAVLGAGVALWSAATFLTGFAGDFVTLLLLRILLGIGESVTFPSASKLIADAVPVSHLGLANGVLAFGYLLGPAAGTFAGGHLMAAYGWRPVFLLFGALSALWILPWSRTRLPPPVNAAAMTQAQPGFGEVLRQRALWGTCLGHFSSNYCYYFILSWLPFYMVRSRGYSMDRMSDFLTFAYIVNAGGALFMGWASDRWIRGGGSTTLIYKLAMAVAHLGGIACMIGVVALPEAGSLASLFVFELISGASYPGIFAIPQIIAGSNATGRWVGLQNAAGNCAGFIAPWITGELLQRTGHFELAFAMAAVVSLLGFVGWVLVLPRVAPLRWSTETAPTGIATAT